ARLSVARECLVRKEVDASEEPRTETTVAGPEAVAIVDGLQEIRAHASADKRVSRAALPVMNQVCADTHLPHAVRLLGIGFRIRPSRAYTETVPSGQVVLIGSFDRGTGRHAALRGHENPDLP